MENLAEVRLWGKQVGALAYDPSSKLSTFEYAQSWRESGVEVSPIHMPLSPQKFQFPSLSFETYRGLPSVFADSLPDDFGNAVINAWLARQGRDPQSFSPVERLLYTGARGMGALEFYPTLGSKNQADQSVELNSLVELAQQVLNERAHLKEAITHQSDPEAMTAILQVGTSAGGARAKAVVAVNKDRTQIRSGQVDAPEGFEHYLLKLDGVEEHKANSETFGDPQGFGRMEYAYYLMAKDAGINISPSELLIEGDRAHFLTKRFDRTHNQKHHYISLCGMDHADFKQPGAYSYEELLTLARKLSLPREDAIEIFRRMVFNIMARNHDDHSKNFGFLLSGPKSNWRLSPAFDVAYSYKPGSRWVNDHQLSLNGKRDNFTKADLKQFAKLIHNFKQADSIIEQIKSVVGEWNYYAKKAGVFDGLQKEVGRNLRLGGRYDW